MEMSLKSFQKGYSLRIFELTQQPFDYVLKKEINRAYLPFSSLQLSEHREERTTLHLWSDIYLDGKPSCDLFVIILVDWQLAEHIMAA